MNKMEELKVESGYTEKNTFFAYNFTFCAYFSRREMPSRTQFLFLKT